MLSIKEIALVFHLKFLLFEIKIRLLSIFTSEKESNNNSN